MTDIHEIGITLQASIDTAHEGAGILEAGKPRREARVAEYAGILTALGEIAARIGHLKETADEVKVTGLEGGGILYEAAQELRNLGSTNGLVTEAASQFHMAGNETAAADRTSMVTVLATEKHSIDGALATVAHLQHQLETSQGYASNLEPFVLLAGGLVETGTSLVERYAADANIPLIEPES
ncbi:MAG TPA: hypothetical protein VLH86_03795 [Patescibacteria group bacterium]|nr:hypothetical protein [Patescibacteria group bacterium]